MFARWLAVVILGASFFHARDAAAQENCFNRLDNGVDMTGWHRSTTNHHGPGTGWAVENGAFIGRQTAGNQGGILMTDKSYKDVEVIFEVKIDWGCDSGFFFRTTAGDRSYQVNVDHLQDAGVGTIYGEGFAQELRYRPYFLSNMGTTATKDPVLTPIFDLAQWPTIWKPTEFNEIRARVEGNPPHMQVWISDLKVMDFTDAMLRAEIDAQGPLAIQVHSGSQRWIAGGTVQYRNIRVKDLTLACMDDGGGGAGGAAGAGGIAGSGGAGGTGAGVAGAGQTNGGGGMATAGGGGSASATGGVPPSTIPNEAFAGAGGGAGTNASVASTDDGGCGCRAAKSRSSGGIVALALLGLMVGRARARARASR